MPVTNRERMRVGFKRLRIVAGVIAAPVIWALIIDSLHYPDLAKTIISVLLAVLGGVVVWLSLFLIGWVIDGFAFAGSDGKATPPPDEDGEHG